MAEAKKGYGLLFIGREPASEGDAFHEQIARSAAGFGGPFAIAIARGIDRQKTIGTRLKILVPVTGTAVSRQGAEVAIALAQASHGSVTALHVADRQRTQRSWRREVGAAIAPMSSAEAIIREIVRLGDPYGVEVKGRLRRSGTPPGDHPPPAEGRRLQSPGDGRQPAARGAAVLLAKFRRKLLERAECSVLFVAGEGRPRWLRNASSLPPRNTRCARPPRPSSCCARLQQLRQQVLIVASMTATLGEAEARTPSI